MLLRRTLIRGFRNKWVREQDTANAANKYPELKGGLLDGVPWNSLGKVVRAAQVRSKAIKESDVRLLEPNKTMSKGGTVSLLGKRYSDGTTRVTNRELVAVMMKGLIYNVDIIYGWCPCYFFRRYRTYCEPMFLKVF